MNKETLNAILDSARWAPSVENLQFWRIQCVSDETLKIVCGDSPGVFSAGGIEGVLHSLGCFLQTLQIAATQFEHSFHWNYAFEDGRHIIEVSFYPDQNASSSLIEFITQRSVDRQHYKKQALEEPVVQELQSCLPEGFAVSIIQTGSQWRDYVWNSFRASVVRFKSDEFINNFSKTIDTQLRISTDKMPLDTLGLSKFENKMFKVLMKKPKAMKVLNCFLGGAYSTALRIDSLPIIHSSAVFYLHDKKADTSSLRLIEQGMAVQMFWLTLCKLGLVMQPNYILYVLGKYPDLNPNKSLAKDLQRTITDQNTFFCGRLGFSTQNTSLCRSVRRELNDLMVK